MPLAGGAPENLTAGNPAADSGPRFSPDGKWLAYRAQKRPGYEADRWELTIMPAAGGTPRSLTGKIDRSIDSFVWAAGSDTIYFTAEQNAGAPIFKLTGQGRQGHRVRQRAARTPRCRHQRRRQAAGLHAGHDGAAARSDAARRQRPGPQS